MVQNKNKKKLQKERKKERKKKYSRISNKKDFFKKKK